MAKTLDDPIEPLFPTESAIYEFSYSDLKDLPPSDFEVRIFINPRTGERGMALPNRCALCCPPPEGTK